MNIQKQKWPICVVTPEQFSMVSFKAYKVRTAPAVSNTGTCFFKAAANSGQELHVCVPWTKSGEFFSITNPLEIQHNIIVRGDGVSLQEFSQLALILEKLVRQATPWFKQVNVDLRTYEVHPRCQ